MNISYAITVCDELDEIRKLIHFLHPHIDKDDEICVLLDKPKASPILLDQLYKWSSNDIITLKESKFLGHFADWKNELIRMCTKDFIFNIDADEIPSESLIENIKSIIEYNPDVESYWVPRWNTVNGLTQEHISKWGWNVDEKNRVQWPDPQMRIFKNHPDIRWGNKVHEKLGGYKLFSYLPGDEGYFLIHEKSIERQEKQNNFYETL